MRSYRSLRADDSLRLEAAHYFACARTIAWLRWRAPEGRGHRGSSRVDDLAVSREAALQGDGHRARVLLHLCAGYCLQVEVRFGAVAGVAAVPKMVADRNALSKLDADAVVLQVAQRDDGAAGGLNHHVVASECRPACGCSAELRECVPDQGQAAERCMIGLGAVHGDDDPVQRCEDGPRPKPGNEAAGSGVSSEVRVSGAVAPELSTGTKSIAKDEAYRGVPWLGTRLAGLF